MHALKGEIKKTYVSLPFEEVVDKFLHKISPSPKLSK